MPPDCKLRCCTARAQCKRQTCTSDGDNDMPTENRDTAPKPGGRRPYHGVDQMYQIDHLDNVDHLGPNLP